MNVDHAARRMSPSSARSGLAAVLVLAAVLRLWSLTVSGYANSWYADGALAASRSWTALFDNAADLSGYVSLDKGPLADWVAGVSARILGFSSSSILLPDALCGIGSVIILHDVVRRTLGHRAALLAALMLALSPVSVVMDRYNDPDALLALLLIASAWALVRALESGRLRHMLLCGGLVGLAFNTKMLEAYLVVPGLAVAFAVAGRGGWRRRLGHLLAAGSVMVVISFAWFTAMMLIPAADRPYVGSTTDNSWFSLIFGYNGLSRLTGGGSSSGVSLISSLTRLFTGAAVGGQIGWLLLLALAGLLGGLWVTRGTAREDRRRAGYLLFGLWALGGFVVFSFAQGDFLPYYTNAMAPAVAALAGGGTVLLLDRFRTRRGWALALAAAVAATAVVSSLLLHDTPSFVPWLRWATLGAAGVAVAGIVVARACARPPGPRRVRIGTSAILSSLALGAGALAVLGGPAAYSIATLGYAQTGSDPAAGPGPGVRAERAAAALDRPDPSLLAYLMAYRDGARYLIAANGSQTAAPFALATGDPVITMGGFSETQYASVPAPTVAQLRRLIADGELRYVIPGIASPRARWVTSHCQALEVNGHAASSTGAVAVHARAGGAARRGAPRPTVYLCTPVDADRRPR